MKITDINKQRSEWKRKGWSIPELRGGKQEWFNIVVELVKIIGSNSAVDLGTTPQLETIDTLYSWRTYAPFLKGVGLVSNRSGVLSLSDEGVAFLQKPTKYALANMLHDKYRLVGEVLDFLTLTPKTVEEIDITHMANAGQITADSLVWKNGMTEWVKAGSVDELKGLFTVMPPIPTDE